MEARPRRSNLWRFLAYARPYRWRLAAATATGVLKFNLPVLFPFILRDLVDHVLAGKPGTLGLSLDGLMALAAVLFVLYAGVSFLRTHLADRLAHRMVRDVRSDLFRHIQSLPIDFFHAEKTGAVSSRLVTDAALAQSFVGLAATNVFMDLTSLVAMTAAIFAMNAKLALLATAVFPVFFVVQRKVARRMRAAAREARARMSELEGRVHESIAGIAEVKGFAHEERSERRFGALAGDFLHAAFATVRAHATSLGATALLTRVPPVLVLWAGGHLVLRGEFTVGALVAFYAFLEMIYNPLGRLADLNVQLATARAAIDRLFELFDREPEEPASQALPALEVREGRIRFECVVFGYAPDRPVLRGLDLAIEPGERVALVGPSGAGKSTTVQLLLRFHDPWEGRITIDGQDLREATRRSIRSRIAVVRQDPYLFGETLAENVRIGRPDASREEIERALESANALDFVRALPRGLETEIGERGVRLSGGERQRIAIARAFLKDAAILVLDEATSSLDLPSEERIREALARLSAGRTTIRIAHRLSSVLDSDRILVLDGGRVVQSGRHPELLADRDGLYRRLVEGFAADRKVEEVTWNTG